MKSRANDMRTKDFIVGLVLRCFVGIGSEGDMN